MDKFACILKPNYDTMIGFTVKLALYLPQSTTVVALGANNRVETCEV
jgi:hypothetical protein